MHHIRPNSIMFVPRLNLPSFTALLFSNMTISAFIASIEQELQEADHCAFTPETVLRDLPNWSSMLALLLIARIDELYGVPISASDFASVRSLNDLFLLVKGHQIA
jgi:acyl carrier protein